MRCFDNIAALIRTTRMNHKMGYSQSQLSKKLGYKNGQFISNVERGLCSVPLKMLLKISDILDLEPSEIKNAMLADHARTLDNHLGLNIAELDEVRIQEVVTKEIVSDTAVS